LTAPLFAVAGACAHGVAGAGHILIKAMLEQPRTRWREARAMRLKRQFENASLYVRDLREEQAERFSHGLNYLFNDWAERFGPVRDREVRTREHTAKEMRRDARGRYEHDMAQPMRSNFPLTMSRRAVCLAKTPHLSTIRRPIIFPKLEMRLGRWRAGQMAAQGKSGSSGF
jgi:hypothetical protein